MCEWGTTIPIEVTVPAEQSYTGKDRRAVRQIDACIAPIVDALNKLGLRTDVSCCGHGKVPGEIVLHDGRKLTITEKK